MKESKEVIKFVDALLDDLIEHKSDDGKIDGFEITQTVVGNLPAAIKAGAGSDEIKKEFQTATEDQREAAYNEAMDVVLKAIKLVTGEK